MTEGVSAGDEVATDSMSKMKTGGKNINKHASVEPIFPPELRKYEAGALTLPGPRATWHRYVIDLSQILTLSCL